MARPRKPEDQRKERSLQVRLTDEQWAFVEAEAARDRRSLADWVRMLIVRKMDAARRPVRV